MENLINLHSSKDDDISKLVDFLAGLNDPKKRKASLKVLDKIKVIFSLQQWDEQILKLLETDDKDLISRVSCLLEISTFTCGVIERNFSAVLAFVSKKITMITDQNGKDFEVMDGDWFNSLSISIVKVCLQLLQFFSGKFKQKLLEERSKSSKGHASSIIISLTNILTTKNYSKDSTWLAGTALALLYNLEATESTSQNLINFVKSLEWNKGPITELNISHFASVSLENVTSFYGQISVINGVFSVGTDWILDGTKGISIFEELLDIALDNCLKVKNANAKYLSFKTIYQLLSFLVTNNRLKKVMKFCEDGLFLKPESKYMKKLFELVRNHVEDLVDGVPQLTQKIFRKLLCLHEQEVDLKACHDKVIYKDLLKTISTQAWFMKGRWMLIAEILPYLSMQELKEIKVHISDELVKCLGTCSLPAISNEVYQSVLNCIRKQGDKKKALLEWVAIYEDITLSCLLHESTLLRQNFGHYWLPSTCTVIPEVLNHLECILMKSESGINGLHAFIILIKSAWQAGLLKIDSLFQRKQYIKQGFESIDLDLRIETFNIVCTNTKKTEPLPQWMQVLILDYVNNNMNCDSAKFRQQLFSSLKRMLLNLRDSSITIYRNILKNRSKNVEDTTLLDALLQQIDFVENLFKISKCAFIPSATFQRKKTGLQIIFLLTEVFVYIKDVHKRKKGSPTESILSLLDYISSLSSDNTSKWDFIMSIDKDLVSCLENRHDEIRELASNILCYQQDVCGDQFLFRNGMFHELLQVGFNLMNSPKYHEAESGGAILHFIATRLAYNSSLENIGKDLFQPKLGILPDYDDCLMRLLHLLIKEGEDSLKASSDDFLFASANRPIFGNTIALSQVIKCFKLTSPKKAELTTMVQKLLHHCIEVTNVITELLSGNVGKESIHHSPSFAEIDEALDMSIKNCKSYSTLCKSLGHLHCRELLLSFCWLNLKSLSFVMAELGMLCNALKKNVIIINDEHLKLIEVFFHKTLITCRHKGVIENSLVALTKFSKCVSTIPFIWMNISMWCRNVIHSSTTLEMHASVTKRSAGIPMFIQAILSAEPLSCHHKLLDETLEHLFEIAFIRPSDNEYVTNDLPQFNAVNILRAIFRDSTLNNAVMRYVEKGVLLTIQGFSSVSWSIRNASTQLLSTLVPRMLGQRLSQEESSQQNTTTSDVFFYHYPQLLELFQKCLYEQATIENDDSGTKILPHLIPVLIFLSKLRSNDNFECTRIYEKLYPLLKGLQSSNVFAIRDLVASAITSITPSSLLKEILYGVRILLKNAIGNNHIHGLYLLCHKLVKDKKLNLSDEVDLLYILSEKELLHFDVDYISHSVLVDILVDISKSNKSIASFNLLYQHSKIGLTAIFIQTNHAIKGLPYLQKSLAYAVVQLLKEDKGDNILEHIEEGLSRNAVNVEEFLDTLIEQFNINFYSFSLVLKRKIAQLVTNSLTFGISLDKAFLFYINCPQEYLPNIEFGILFKHLNSKRLYNILPCVCRNICRNPSVKVKLDEEVYLFIARMINNYSSPDVDENKRMAAARSLGLIEILIGNKSSHKTILKLLFWSTLNLLQDEDENIRIQATKSLQFLNPALEGNLKHHLQCNIVLKKFFGIYRKYPSCEDSFLEWMFEVLTSASEKDFINNLILFEQESSNLFAEEFTVIELIGVSLPEMKNCELMLNVTGELIEKLKCLFVEVNQIFSLQNKDYVKSLNGVFMERNLFNKFFKCLKIIEILVVLNGNKTFPKCIDVSKILEIAKKFICAPSVRSAVVTIENGLQPSTS